MEYKLYLKNNIKITNIYNNDTLLNILLEKYLEKFSINTDNVSDNFFKLDTNAPKILFIGGTISESHIRNLLLKNNTSYFLTISPHTKYINNYIGEVISNYTFTTTFVPYANTIDKIYIDRATAKFFGNKFNVPDIGLNHGVVYNLLYILKIGGCLYIPKEDIKLDYIKKCTDKKSPNYNRAFNITKTIKTQDHRYVCFNINFTNLLYYESEIDKIKTTNTNVYRDKLTPDEKNTNIETINELLLTLYGITNTYVGDIVGNYRYGYSNYIKYTKTKDI